MTIEEELAQTRIQLAAAQAAIEDHDKRFRDCVMLAECVDLSLLTQVKREAVQPFARLLNEAAGYLHAKVLNTPLRHRIDDLLTKHEKYYGKD